MTTKPAVARPWVFVAGGARSGSTLVGVLLEERLDAFCCGELHSLWHGLVSGWDCACGVEMAHCPLWKSVAADVRAELGLAGNAEAAEIMRMRLRRRHLLAPRMPRPRMRELELRRSTERAIERHVPSPVIIDTSKWSSILWTAGHIRRPLSVVHLLRDPRAVAFSQGSPTPSPARRNRPMRHRGTVASASDWLRAQVTTERVVAHRAELPAAVRIVRVRYEDLMDGDRDPLEDIVASLPSTPRDVGDTGRSPHRIGGNTVRHGGRKLESNERWRAEMGARQRFVVTALTMPMLARYDYPVIP